MVVRYHLSLVKSESKQKGMGSRTHTERLVLARSNHKREEEWVGGQRW